MQIIPSDLGQTVTCCWGVSKGVGCGRVGEARVWCPEVFPATSPCVAQGCAWRPSRQLPGALESCLQALLTLQSPDTREVSLCPTARIHGTAPMPVCPEGPLRDSVSSQRHRRCVQEGAGNLRGTGKVLVRSSTFSLAVASATHALAKAGSTETWGSAPLLV